jgi:hypothetical protein
LWSDAAGSIKVTLYDPKVPLFRAAAKKFPNDCKAATGGLEKINQLPHFHAKNCFICLLEEIYFLGKQSSIKT